MEDIGKIKKGIKIKINGQPHLVTDFEFKKPGKGQAVYRCKLKNLIQGNSFDHTWRSGDKFEKAEISNKTAHFSYIDGENFIFIDEDYEQIFVHKKLLKDNSIFLTDDMECELLYFENSLIEVIIPNFVDKKILYTEPGHKGDTTSSNVMKPAKIENDLEIYVPLFIKTGDVVRIDTRTRKYSERVSKG